MSHKITLTSLANATEQQVFNQVANHLLTQKKKSKNKDTKCLYRNKSGLKCAAGCLISDAQYKPEFDKGDSSWFSIVERFNLTKNHKIFIKKLQNIHDDNHPNQWFKQLNELAENHKLNTLVLNKFKKVK